jgi:hypothetical protein
MSSAPPVRIHVVPDRLSRGFALVCASLAAANLMAWILSWADASSGMSAIAVPVAAAAAAVLTWRLLDRRSDATGALIWDGSAWQWAPELDVPWPGRVRVMIDLGPWLLLHFRPTSPTGHGVWLAASRFAAAGQWPAWRAALFAPVADKRLPETTVST